MPSRSPATSTPRPGQWGNFLLGLGLLASVAAGLGLLTSPAAPPATTVTMRPVEAVTTADLRRAADALEALAATRLTPRERDQVEEVGRIVDGLAGGDVVITPPPPPPTTITTTTTTTSVPPTTRTPRQWADEFIDSYPHAPTTSAP